MKAIKYIGLILILAIASCESMTDTYSEYAGDGPIKYLGKIKNLTIVPGWERFTVSWENSLDSDIAEIRLDIEAKDEEKITIFLEPDVSSYETEQTLHFNNKTYTFTVTCLDDNGNESLSTVNYSRAFNPEHEKVVSYGALQTKYYYYQNKILILLSEKNDDITDAAVLYTCDGEEKVRSIVDSDYDNRMIVIDNIDDDTDVLIKRNAIISGCEDVIEFEPYILDQTKVSLALDLIGELANNYNLAESEIMTKEWRESVTELHLNYDIQSLADLLYFPNLSKLHLGSMRYLHEDHTTSALATLNEEYREISTAILQIIKDATPGFEIDVYNGHYDLSSLDFINEMSNPSLDVTTISMDNSTVECNTAKEGAELAENLNYLIDENESTVWTPLSDDDNLIRTHEIIITFDEVKSISGVLLKQRLIAAVPDLFPLSVSVFVSEDKYAWNNAISTLERPLGQGIGETTKINFTEVTDAKYVKVMMKDRLGYRRVIELADIIVY